MSDAITTVLTDDGDNDVTQTPEEIAAATEATAATESTAATEEVTEAQKILDADDSSADDKAAAQAIVDAAADDTGNNDDVAPDTYADFTVPEGTDIDVATLEAATPLFKELGLTQKQAQKLVDFQAAQVQAGSQKQSDTFNQLMETWKTDAKNDKEFGGDAFEENVKTAQVAISKYGTPELKQLLEDHGVGNHPEVIRFMLNVGKTLKEDVPDGDGTAVSKANDRVSILYPK